jgi:uncharacterized protein (DUF302 family)
VKQGPVSFARVVQRSRIVQQTIGLDLSLRVLIWEEESGGVWLTYRQSGVLAREHHLAGREQAVKALDDGLATLTHAATSIES